MKGRAPNKKDREWFDAITQIGCIVCMRDLNIFTPPAIHHIEGKTKHGAHLNSIPLCHNHHQNKSNTGEWVSRHGDGRSAFEKEYGTEQSLLELTKITASILFV